MFNFLKRLFSPSVRPPLKRLSRLAPSSLLVDTRLVMPRSSVSRPVVSVSDSAVFKQLSGACFCDRAKAERLVQVEISKGSGITREVAIQQAFERLQHDRR